MEVTHQYTIYVWRSLSPVQAWHAGRDGLAEHCKARIPGAQYFDIDKVADTSIPLPHMLPSAVQFAAAMDSLGIRNDSQVVIYDGAGIFSAPRAWWTFKAFGHKRWASNILSWMLCCSKHVCWLNNMIVIWKFLEATHGSSRCCQSAADRM